MNSMCSGKARSDGGLQCSKRAQSAAIVFVYKKVKPQTQPRSSIGVPDRNLLGLWSFVPHGYEVRGLRQVEPAGVEVGSRGVAYWHKNVIRLKPAAVTHSQRKGEPKRTSGDALRPQDA
jgi:hypothetical protein